MIILTPGGKYEFEARDNSDRNSDKAVIKETWVENVYHIERSDFHETGVLIDLGANIGSVSVYAASLNDIEEERFKDYPKIRVIAYEPEPSNLRYLADNVRRNFEDSSVVKIVPQAVGEAQGQAYITDQQGNSRLAAEGAPVPVVTLKDVFVQNGLKECDVLKMDIEGSEYPVIRGASEDTLKRIKYLTMEFTGTDEGADPADFGEMVTKLAKVFNLHVLGSPERGGYITGRRY